MPTKTLTASCYCKSVQYSVEIPTSLLPLPVHLCHCSVCRYTHGTLCIFHTKLPKGRTPNFIAPSSLGAMTAYRHATAETDRFFCSTCGCHVGDRGLGVGDSTNSGERGNDDVASAEGDWIVATPLFAEHGEDVFQIKKHCFTEGSTGGSGLFTWLPTIGDRPVEVWNPASPDRGRGRPIEDDMPPRQKEFDEDGNEVLRAECHCGGVSFTIPRPTLPIVQGDAYMSKYMSPRDGNKWMACLDACGDCRLQCGTLVTAWAFVPRALLKPPMPLGLAPYGTMKTFASSPGVLRGFCGRCGATAVYSCEGRTPTPEQQVVDISVGLFRAPEGVLAEEWMTWRADHPANMDDANMVNPLFAKSLEEGHKKWSITRYGDALDIAIN